MRGDRSADADLARTRARARNDRDAPGWGRRRWRDDGRSRASLESGSRHCSSGPPVAADELGMAVLRTAGAPSEAQMAFAGLQRLLRPYLVRLDDLPGPQRDALSLAFGLRVQPAPATPPDIFLIALATLDLLADAAASSPLVLLVEDVQWLDSATTDVLAFVARRIEVEPVVVLFTLREGSESPLEAAHLPELPARRPRRAARRAAARFDRARAAARGARTGTRDGVRQPTCPRRAGERQRRANGFDAYAGSAPLPITERLERAFSDRLRTLPETTRSCSSSLRSTRAAG